MSKGGSKLSAETFGMAIILIALGAPIIRYGLAFQAAEPPLRIWGLEWNLSPVTGFLFGASYEGSGFFGIREGFRAKKRQPANPPRGWWWPIASALGQLLVGAFIVVPVLQAELQGAPLESLLGGWLGWAWTIVISLAPFLCLLTVSLALAVQKKEQTKAKRSDGEGSGSKPSAARHFATCSRCGWQGKAEGYPSERAAKNAENAHRCAEGEL